MRSISPYTWTITNGNSRLVFENNSSTITKTNTNTVGIASTGYSIQANDVDVQLQFTPAGTSSSVTASRSLSIDSPYKLVSMGTTSNRGVAGSSCLNPPNGTDGFQSLVPYRIVSFFGVQISNIAINETFPSEADDYIGNNWGTFAGLAGSYTTPDGTFADNLCVIHPTGTPPSLPPQSPLSTVKVDHASQFWFVGTTTQGGGVGVQSNTVQRYQDHALHHSITSPIR